MNVAEATSRIAYLEVQVQELRAENRSFGNVSIFNIFSCLTREVANLNKKVDELIKVLEPPSLTRLNSSGRFSANGSTMNTPRCQDTDLNGSQHSFSNSSNFPTTEISSPDKDRLLKKLSSEIESLKFKFSKISNDIASLKTKELSKADHSEIISEEAPYSPSKVSSKNQFRGIADEDNPDFDRSPKWTLSKQGDSPLVRMGTDKPKPNKRQSPTSYGVSPPSNGMSIPLFFSF